VAKKVLILCNDFPPINSIGADRPYSWYKYFKEFDLEPIVITKNWITDGNNGVPLVHNKKDYEITEYGEVIRSKMRHTPSTKFQEIFDNRFSIVRKGLSFVEITLGYYFSSLDRHRSIYNEANEYLKKNKVDIVITTGEPFILFLYGLRLKRKFGVKWVVDYRDGWYLNHIRTLQKDIFNKIIKNWELRIEKKITQHADLITTVDPEMAERLSKLLIKKVEVVYNGFWDFHKLEFKKLNNDELIINHTGTLTPGQQLELFLDVLKELYADKKIEEGKFYFNLIGLEYFPNQMKRLIPYNDLIGKIIFTTPRLSKEEAIKLNAQADYLLNFTDPNLSAIYAKTYDYIATKKPILVVPGDKKLLENLVIENKLGFVLNSKEEIKSFVTNPIKWNSCGANVSFFTRQNQTELFVSKLNTIVN
jgi:hypothetical protein